MAAVSDDVVWQIINAQFCSFKVTTPQEGNENFCRNEYNVTGICSRITCPLANSQYSTVRNIDGELYLYIKLPERAHMPNKWWERIKLSNDYQKALEQIDEHLAYWPDRMVDRVKQRLTRLTQVLLTERRLALQTSDERHYTTKSSKVKRREQSRERKALVAAKLERAIERELLERLKSGAYGDQPLNVDEAVWTKVMRGVKSQGEELKQTEEEAEGAEAEVEYVEDDDEDDELVDVEDIEKWLGSGASDSDSGSASSASSGSDSESARKPKPKPRKRVKASRPSQNGARGNFEYELEDEHAEVARA